MKQSTTVTRLANTLCWIYAFVLVLLPFHALVTTWAGSNFGHLDLLRIWKEILIVASLPIVLWLLWLSEAVKKWLISSWVARLFVLYILLHLVLGFWALSNHQLTGTAFIYALIINLRFIGFLILCALVSAHSEFLRKNWRAVLLIPAVVVVIFGIFQKFVLPYDFLKHFGYGPKTIPAYQTVDSNLDYRRIQSTLRGANPLGAYLVLVITAILVVLRKNRKVLVTILIGSLIVLFYSYSRSAAVAAIVALLVLLWLSRKKYRLNLWTGVILALLVVTGGSLYFLRSNQVAQDTLLHTSSSSKSAESSNQKRWQSIKTGAKDVIHQPLGRGPGTAGPASFRNNHPARIAENYFLQIGQEVGVLGMALFITINVLVAKELWQRRQDQLAKMLLASLVGLTFVNLVSHAWTDDTLAYIWWGLAGVALAPKLVKNSKAQAQ